MNKTTDINLRALKMLVKLNQISKDLRKKYISIKREDIKNENNQNK